MPAINANTGPFLHPKFQFRPNAGDTFHGGPRENPIEEEYGKKTRAALITVGLTSQNETRKFSERDVVRIVKRVREDQSGDPSATFVTQVGIYKHPDNERVVTEKGVRVIILNTNPDESKKKFRKNMVKLAEALAEELDQHRVLLEEQKGGITADVFGISARR